MSGCDKFGLWRCNPVKKDRWILLGILLLAASFRFNNLEEPGLWLDEVAYSIAAQSPIIEQIINPTEALPDSHSSDPSLSAIPFALSLKLGLSNYLVRFPAALFGILSVAIFYRLGRILFGNIVGIIAAILLSTNSFHILYSQEARNYSQFIFFSLGSFWFLYRATVQNRKINWFFYILFTFGAVSTNHLMAFVIFVQGIFLFIAFSKDMVVQKFKSSAVTIAVKTWSYFFLSVFVVYLLRLPWLEDFTNRRCTGCAIGMPSYDLNLGHGFQSLQAFTSNNSIFMWMLIILCVLGLIIGLIKFSKSGILLLCWLILSIPVSTIGLWFISQFFHPRYTIWGLPAILLATACGIVGIVALVQKLLGNNALLSKRNINVVNSVSISLLLLPILMMNWGQIQHNPAIKQGWPLGKLQEATTYIATEANDSELIIGVPNSQFLQYYLQQSRNDLLYFDANKIDSLPAEFNGRWYAFLDVQHVPERWQQQLTHGQFYDIIVVYSPDTCPIQDCVDETKLMFLELAQANPDTAIAEKIDIMLSGIDTLVSPQ